MKVDLPEHLIRTGAFVSAIFALFAATRAPAQVSFELIGECLATDISADGSVIVGNTVNDYETFRWTQRDGIVRLGRATQPVLGTGAGTPDVSADGTKVSATILGDDGTYATQGIWTLGAGWHQCMPPTPADGGLLDSTYGSAWGLSGDGNVLTGLYWRPGQPGGSAHPSRWTQAAGVLDLGTPGRSGRANGTNTDGSVIAGWVENPTSGVWWPTVWVNGIRTVLRETDGFAEATAVSPDGSIVVGSSWFPPVTQFSVEEAAFWNWNGSQWVEHRIGKLPGTAMPFGTASAQGLSADGSMIVGYNRFGEGNDTGFIWTQQTGMQDVVDYLASQGVAPGDFDFQTVSSISADGSVLIGVGYHTYPPYAQESFRITRCVLPGDMNKDLKVDGRDIAGFVRAKLGQSPLAGENPVCANYGGTLDTDIAAFTADLLAG